MMGQTIRRIIQLEADHQSVHGRKRSIRGYYKDKFPDLTELPPELSLAVLSHLKATDLCLASCVWDGLAKDEILWQGLCMEQWGYVTAYRNHPPDISYRKLYLQLDEASLTFNADYNKGMEYLLVNDLLSSDPKEIALFVHNTDVLSRRQIRAFLEGRPDVLEDLVSLQDYGDQFLPQALRKFFEEINAPNERNHYLHTLLDKFSTRFCQCNPHYKLTPDAVYLLCFSLILLSVDLASPHVKNKMSKREFIRNVRNALPMRVDDGLYGHLYDDIYLKGHVAPHSTD